MVFHKAGHVAQAGRLAHEVNGAIRPKSLDTSAVPKYSLSQAAMLLTRLQTAMGHANRLVRMLVLLHLGAGIAWLGLNPRDTATHMTTLDKVILGALLVVLLMPRRMAPKTWRENLALRRASVVLLPLAAALTILASRVAESSASAWTDAFKLLCCFAPWTALALAARWWLPETASPSTRSGMLILPYLVGLPLLLIMIYFRARS
jgi:hypothetical protein